MTLLASCFFFFFFFEILMALLLVAKICSFYSPVLSCLRYLIFFFLSFFSYSKGFATLISGKADFGFLTLGFLEQDFLMVVSWVCIFEVMLLKKQWLLGQLESVFLTMALDCKPVFAFQLTAFCTIFSKLIDAWFCYFILILMKGLRSF